MKYQLTISNKGLPTLLFIALLFICKSVYSIQIPQTEQGFISDSLSTTVDSSKNALSLKDSTKSDTIIIPKSKSALTSKINYKAKDSIRYSMDLKEAYLYGDAEVTYEDIKLIAEFIKVDQENMIIYASGVTDSTGKAKGKPIFTQGKDSYKSESMTYNFKTNKGKIKEVYTEQGEGYLLGEAVKVVREEGKKDIIYGYKNKYTTCNLDHPHFYIGINKAKITEKQIVSGPAFLVIEDVPLPLVVPFGFFPNSTGRKSGIIIPSYGTSQSQGFFLSGLGFYWGSNDFFDAAIQSDIYTNGSFNSNSNIRYRKRYKYNGNLGFDYGIIRNGVRELEPLGGYNVVENFRIRWRHAQDAKANPGSTFSANVNAGSSSYLRNFSYDINQNLSNQLSSSISYTKSFRNSPFSMSISGAHNQNLVNKTVNVTLPQFVTTMSRINPLENKNRVGKAAFYEKLGVNYTLNAQNTISTSDSILFTPEAKGLLKNGVSHSIPVSLPITVFKYAKLTPNITYRDVWYFKEINKSFDAGLNQVVNDTINGFTRYGSVNFGTNLSTQLYGFLKVNALGVSAIRHVFQPTFSYSVTPDYSTSDYNYFKTVQSDSLGTIQTYSIHEGGIFGTPSSRKQQNVGVNLGNNIEMKVRSKKDTVTGFKKIPIFNSLNGSARYNLAADSLNLSTISISGNTTLFEKIRVNFNGGIDPYQIIADTNGNAIKINEYQYIKDQRVGRLTSASVAIGGNLNPEILKRTISPEMAIDPALQYYIQDPSQYVDFNIPWSLGVNFNLTYSKPGFEKPNYTKSLRFNGDINVTEKWKVGFSSGYDLEDREITATSLSIYRDLHCWDLSIQWNPIGVRTFYLINLKVKASVLQDLKLSKRSPNYFN
ncbi:MAG: hypothetical protein ACJAZ3_000327 [Sphingobacteriales bacterium]